jgi:hypothetical protein
MSELLAPLYYVNMDTLEVESSAEYHKFDSSWRGSSTWEYSIKVSTGHIELSESLCSHSELKVTQFLERVLANRRECLDIDIAALMDQLPNLIVKKLLVEAKLIELNGGL